MGELIQSPKECLRIKYKCVSILFSLYILAIIFLIQVNGEH